MSFRWKPMMIVNTLVRQRRKRNKKRTGTRTTSRCSMILTISACAFGCHYYFSLLFAEEETDRSCRDEREKQFLSRCYWLSCNTRTTSMFFWLVSFLEDSPGLRASSFRRSTMVPLVGLLFLPSLIQSCTVQDALSQQSSTDVIFTGRILSLHQWSVEHPYSAFVWVLRILQGEARLLEHYQWADLQRPLYVVVDQLQPCQDGSSLKYYEVKIFGVRIQHARFYSNFVPLSITVANLKAIDGKMSFFIHQTSFLACLLTGDKD